MTTVEKHASRKEEEKIREAETRRLAEAVTIRMVESGLAAVSRFDGHEFCWFDLVPVVRSGSSIVLKPGRNATREDYEIVHHALGMGLLGILPIDENEVYLPTPAAWNLAGLEFDEAKASAPDDWRRIHGDWRRRSWTRIARENDVRIYPVTRDPPERRDEDGNEKSAEFHASHFGYLRGDVGIMGGPYFGNVAGWRPGHEVQFHKDYSCPLDPFTGGDYADVDALLVDLHADGRYVTDHRRAVGTVDDPAEVSRDLRAGMVVEYGHQAWMLMPPRVDGRHEDFRYVSRRTAEAMRKDGSLAAIGRVGFRHGEGYEAFTLPELVPASGKSRRSSPSPESDTSAILAHDDEDRPITENDIVVESHRRPLDTAPLCVLPTFDYLGTDEEWETEQLVEAVRARRRLVGQSETEEDDTDAFDPNEEPDGNAPALRDPGTLSSEGIETLHGLAATLLSALLADDLRDLPEGTEFNVSYEPSSGNGKTRTSLSVGTFSDSGYRKWHAADVPSCIGVFVEEWWRGVAPEGCVVRHVHFGGRVGGIADPSPSVEDLRPKLRSLMSDAVEAAKGNDNLWLEFGEDRTPRTFRAYDWDRGHRRIPSPGLQRVLRSSKEWRGAVDDIRFSVRLPEGRDRAPPRPRTRPGR